MQGVRSPLQAASETLYADCSLERGGRFQIEASHEERALYILSGALSVEGMEHGDSTLLILRSGVPVEVQATESARFMVFGGEPMEGPRYIWWNFVSSRLERIEQAKEEWRQGRFDTVPGDEEDFIPLPKDNTKPRRSTGGRAFE